jgi:hypothetical protein
MKDDVGISAQCKILQSEGFVTNIDLIFGTVCRLFIGRYAVLFPARERDFSHFQNFQTGCEPT